MREMQELTFAEVIQVFRRNIVLVLAVLIITTLIVCGYTHLKPKLYSYEGLIELPQIEDPDQATGPKGTGGNGSAAALPARLIDPDEAATVLKFKFAGKPVSGGGAYLSQVQIQDNGRTALNPYYESSLIALTTLGPSLQSAKTELEAVVSGLQSAFDLKLKRLSQESLQQVKEINEQINSMRAMLDSIDHIATGRRDPALLIALTMKRESLQNQIIQLIHEKRRANRLAPDSSPGIRLLAESPVSTAPVSPKLEKGILLGVLLGCVLAFVLVLANEARKRERLS